MSFENERSRCFLNRVNDATVKLDRIMEVVLDTTNAEDSEGAPAAAQPSYEWRPQTRDFGGLERRMGRMEENVASIFETVKTLVDLLHNQRVCNRNLSCRVFLDADCVTSKLVSTTS